MCHATCPAIANRSAFKVQALIITAASGVPYGIAFVETLESRALNGNHASPRRGPASPLSHAELPAHKSLKKTYTLERWEAEFGVDAQSAEATSAGYGDLPWLPFQRQKRRELRPALRKLNARTMALLGGRMRSCCWVMEKSCQEIAEFCVS